MRLRAALPETKSNKSVHTKGSRSVLQAIPAQRESLESAVSIAEERGLLKERRTLVIRGRMPEKLVAEAKRKTGITSDSKLLEAALANIVVADDYAEWLYSQRGTIDPSLDLEF